MAPPPPSPAPPRSNVVAHLRNRYPSSLLFAAGWSLGANIMTRYLGAWVGGVAKDTAALAGHMHAAGVAAKALLQGGLQCAAAAAACKLAGRPRRPPHPLPAAGEEGDRTPLSAAVAMCNPFDLVRRRPRAACRWPLVPVERAAARPPA